MNSAKSCCSIMLSVFGICEVALGVQDDGRGRVGRVMSCVDKDGDRVARGEKAMDSSHTCACVDNEVLWLREEA